jgi:upstream activation factor subunit UAF30
MEKQSPSGSRQRSIVHERFPMIAAMPFDVHLEISTESLRVTKKEEVEMATKTSSKGGGKGLAAEVTPSADLSAIVGTTPIPRSEVTKRVWDYIKANGLQDQTNKRMINADDKLRVIFGGKDQVSMFEMTALVNKHLKA